MGFILFLIYALGFSLTVNVALLTIIFIIISIFEVQYLASLQMGTLQMITKK